MLFILCNVFIACSHFNIAAVRAWTESLYVDRVWYEITFSNFTPYFIRTVCAQIRLEYVHPFLPQGLIPFFPSHLLSFLSTIRKVGTLSLPH